MSSRAYTTSSPLKSTSLNSSPGSSVSGRSPVSQGSAKLPTEEDLHSSLRYRLTHLRGENSQLVTQSHRLISDLEDTSHHLVLATNTINELQAQLAREKAGPSRDRVAIFEAQIKSLQSTLTKNASLQSRLEHVTTNQQREKDEWRMRQKAIEEQLGDVQEECRRLREACSMAEERAVSEKDLSTRSLSHLSRTHSSQSLNTYPHHLRSHTPTNSHHYPSSAFQPKTSSAPDPTPLANSTLLNHSLTRSTSSLTSVKSTQSLREFPSSYARLQPHYATAYGSGSSRSLLGGATTSTPRLGYSQSSYSLSSKQGLGLERRDQGRGMGKPELERARSRIRHLEKEVLLLEKQLADKTKAASGHVEELTRLRTQLAQERASLAMLREESKHRSASELKRVKSVHADQLRELQTQLERLMEERGVTGKEIGQLRGALKASHSEAGSLSEKASNLLRELEQERGSHAEAMRSLRTELGSGSARVTDLERALQGCQRELDSHVTRVEEADRLHRGEVEQLRKQVTSLSSELAQAQHQILERTSLVSRLGAEVERVKGELLRGEGVWQEREGELRQSQEQGEVIRRSLLQQVERSSHELSMYSTRLAEYQQAAVELKRCQSENSHLRRTVSELEKHRGQWEKGREEGRGERERLMADVDELRRNLEAAGLKVDEADGRGREEQRSRQQAERELFALKEEMKKVEGELELSRSELANMETRSQEHDKEVEASLGHMQQELAKRAQQVLEMEGLLRSHQADTTARRLQLERALAQRQGELRSRTQGLEELTVKHSEARKRIEELRQQVAQLQSAGASISSEKQKQLQSKNSELVSLQNRLKEAESASMLKRRALEQANKELSEIRLGRQELERRCQSLEKQLQKLQRETDGIREQHLTQVQSLQETHTTLLASREQQASTHRLQVQQLSESDRRRQEEVSRCRAQVVSLSAELAAERQVAEESRRHVALARAEAARYQAQLSSLQRAVSINNMAHLSLPRGSGLANGRTVSGRDSDPVPSLPAIHTPSPAPPPPSHIIAGRLPNHVAVETAHITLESTLDLESDVEFAQLPTKMTAVSLAHTPNSNPGNSTGRMQGRGEIINI